MARHKVRWPLARHLVAKPDWNKDKGLIVDLFLCHDRTSGPLWDEFDALTKLIDDNPRLTPLGKTEARAEEVAKFRQRDDFKRHVEAVEKGKQRIQELRTALAKRPAPKDESAYDGTARAHREHRAVMRYEALPPDQRRAALRAAIQARDTNFLRPLYDESGLLNDTDHRLVEAVLLESVDRPAFVEFTELAGKFSHDGTHDPQTSIVNVAGYSLDQLVEHMDSWAGLDRETEETRALLAEQLKTPNAPLTITPEQAHSPSVYRAARDLAAQHGRVLSIVGDEGQGDIAPGANGAGGQ